MFEIETVKNIKDWVDTCESNQNPLLLLKTFKPNPFSGEIVTPNKEFKIKDLQYFNSRHIVIVKADSTKVYPVKINSSNKNKDDDNDNNGATFVFLCVASILVDLFLLPLTNDVNYLRNIFLTKILTAFTILLNQFYPLFNILPNDNDTLLVKESDLSSIINQPSKKLKRI